MSRFILPLTMIASLVAVSGCGAHRTATANVANISNDPSWCGPSDEFSIVDAKVRTVRTANVHTEDAIEMKPNASRRPTSGAVHAVN